jgi:hypothetical protein
MPDLWPTDIGTTEVTPPVTLLKEQAALLGEKTRNLVEGKVVRLDEWPSAQGHFAYAFYLVAPALGNYRYKLFTLSYPPEFLPIRIDVDRDLLPAIPQECVLQDAVIGTWVKAESEDAYKQILAAIFGAAKTRRVVAAIVAQSTS